VCDDAPPLRKYLNVEVEGKDVNPETGMRTFEFIASTDAVDREGDILFPDGWELENYQDNPVILWAHESWSYPIGRSLRTEVKNNRLVTEVEFTPMEVNPEGYRVYKLVEAGFVKAVSVGFRPRAWVWNDEHAGYDFERNELLEISVVPVPANQEALLAAGIDADTAKWYGGMTKGAAASMVLDEIIKTAINFNVANEPPVDGATQKDETTSAVMYVSCASETDSGDTTAVTYTDSSGNTWDGAVWVDPGFSTPWKGNGDNVIDYGQPQKYVLPDQFVWPPPNTKEVEMTKELIEALNKLNDTIADLPDTITERVLEALEVDDTIEDADADAAVEPAKDADDTVVDPADADPVDDDTITVDDDTPAPDADTTDDDETLEVEDLTEDGLRGMVGDVLREARTATTGRLPD
jgi:HK97 family phage prohead protease